MAKITNIKGRQVFDSRGIPTVEAEVFLEDGSSASAIVPSGASTGKHEAFELRDLENKEYLGKSVLNSVKNINRTIVSTDCKEIAEISKKCGAEIIIRPGHISTDISTTESAIQHVLTELKNANNYIPDIVVLLQLTSPLRKKNDIDGAIEYFINQKADT